MYIQGRYFYFFLIANKPPAEASPPTLPPSPEDHTDLHLQPSSSPTPLPQLTALAVTALAGIPWEPTSHACQGSK